MDRLAEAERTGTALELEQLSRAWWLGGTLWDTVLLEFSANVCGIDPVAIAIWVHHTVEVPLLLKGLAHTYEEAV